MTADRKGVTTRSNLGGGPLATAMSRFRLMRSAVRALEHAAKRLPSWGDPQAREFTQSLVSQLSPAQLAEFKLVFRLFDVDGNGEVIARTSHSFWNVVTYQAPKQSPRIAVLVTSPQ
jgi:hypothetical protein